MPNAPLEVPEEDAFTVFDLLRIISKDDGNRLLLDSDLFKYNRIGRPRMAEPVSFETGAAPLQFEATAGSEGVPVSALIYNETRPNVSVQTRREGTVNLASRKEGFHPKIPDVFPTYVYRNYTIIRDGLVNVETLPLRLIDDTVRKMKEAGFPASAVEVNSPGIYVIKLRELPIINRAMVQATSAKKLFELEYALTAARAGQKVYNTYLKDGFDQRTSEGFKVLYGIDGAEWLKDQGLTDYGGFKLGGKQAKAMDVYMGKELHVALKGLSSLPTLKDVQTRIASGKHTASSSLMAPFVKEVEDFLASSVYANAADPAKVYRAWLEGQAADTKKRVRDLLHQVSQIRMTVIVGNTWFKEFDSLDQNSLAIQGIDGKDIQGTITMKEIEVAI